MTAQIGLQDGSYIISSGIEMVETGTHLVVKARMKGVRTIIVPVTPAINTRRVGILVVNTTPSLHLPLRRIINLIPWCPVSFTFNYPTVPHGRSFF
jgi:hypothetical protein